MDCFVLNCPLAGLSVEIRFTGGIKVRGRAEFRGFACESEPQCERARIRCGLYDALGAHPFSASDAWRHLNG